MLRAGDVLMLMFVRENLCLDYVNTLSWRGTGQPTEALADFGGLVAWLRSSRAWDGTVLALAEAWRAKYPAKAAGLFRSALEVREVLYRVFNAAVETGRVPERDFAAMQRTLARVPRRGRLVAADGKFAWQVARIHLAAPVLLAPVMWSAADMLAGEARTRLRRCANDRCLWMFVDRSRTGTRRWCDMASCGNRAKAHRHYLKAKILSA